MDRKFLERLAWYVFGVAIGLVLLGYVQMKRSQAHQQRVQQEAQQEAQQAIQQQPADPQPTGESAADAPTDP